MFNQPNEKLFTDNNPVVKIVTRIKAMIHTQSGPRYGAKKM